MDMTIQIAADNIGDVLLMAFHVADAVAGQLGGILALM